MKNSKDFVIDPRVIEITLMIWPDLSVMRQGEEKVFDAGKYDITYLGERINQIKVIKLGETGGHENVDGAIKTDGFCIITARGAGGLAHEISHLTYKNEGNPQTFSGPLVAHILPVIKDQGTIADYFGKLAPTEYDKLIGYLYLADEDELRAKLTGCYVGRLVTDNVSEHGDEYLESLVVIYSEMRTFNPEIAEILEIEKEKNVISRHLGSKGQVHSETISTLLEEIHNQGEKFLKIYHELFD